MSQDAIFPDLAKASVLITGGGSGIGAALVDGFLGQEAQVAFLDIAESSAFVRDMETKHGRAPLFLKVDVTDTEALRKAVAEASAAHGTVTVLVNNAADDQRHTLEEMTPEFWDRMQAINLKSYYFACQAVVPGMIAAGGGRIVNFTSTSYMLGMGGLVAYTTANAGISAMTHGLARELGPSDIRVNAVAPGWVLTEKQRAKWVTPDSLAAHLARQCLPEEMVPSDMVAPVLFLASGASRMISGQVIAVDGGIVVSG